MPTIGPGNAGGNAAISTIRLAVSHPNNSQFVGDPTASGNVTASPAAIALTATVPAPTVTGGGTPVPCVVTHIASAQTTPGTSATNTLTPTNWTPQANALIVVCVNIVINDGGSGATTFSVADTFSGSSAWTERKTFGGTLDNSSSVYSHRESIFTMQAGATPGSHSLTVTRTAGNVNQWFWIDVFEVTGHDTTTPVVNTADTVGSGFSGLNAWMVAKPALGEAPTSASITTASFGGVSNSYCDPPTGWTTGTDSFSAGFTTEYISAYRIGGAGLPRWTMSAVEQNTNGMYAVGIEIAAAAPSGFGVREAVQGIAAASTTLDLTVVTVGNNPILIAELGVGAQAGTDPGNTSTATYNGVAMTSLGKIHSNNDVWGYIEIFWLAAPAAGSHTLHFTSSTAHDLTGSGLVIGEAAQTQPTVVEFEAGSGAVTPSMTLAGTTAASLCVAFLGPGEFVNYSIDPSLAWTNAHVNVASAVTNSYAQTQAGNGGTVTFSAQKDTAGWYAYGAVEILPGAPGGGGDATATPAAIALSVTVPAPTVRGSSNTTPAVIALTTTTPAPTTRGSSNTTPAAVALTTSVPAPTATGTSGGTATPSAVALTVVTPAPTATGQQNVAATPAVIALTVVTPAPTTRGNAGTSPTAIALAAVTPAPTVNGGASTAPAAITRTVVTPAPTVSGGATVTPAAIARTVVTPAPTATGTGNGTATPAAIALTVTVPAPTVTGAAGGTATPAAIALAVSVPAPTVRGGASTTPAAIARTVTVPNPTVSGGSSTQPSSIVLAVVVPQPTATGSGGGTATPATIALAVTVPAPTVRGQGRALPAAVALVAVVPVPSTSGGASASPATVAVLVIVSTPIDVSLYLPYWGARVG